MAKIPLNYFRRLSLKATPDTYQYTTFGILSSVYEAPFQRASVVISALATNTSTTQTNTIFAAVSTRPTPISQSTPLVPFISNFSIAPNDTVNIVINKLVLSQYDNLFIWTPNTNVGDLYLTLSILETVNTQ